MKNFTCIVLLLLSFIPVVHADETSFLPPKNLYDVPIADPRWPKFSTSVSKDFKGNLGKSIWGFTFGENIGLVQHDYASGKYEFGIQAATFGVMDIHSTPTRLVNSDYLVGVGLSHSAGYIQHLFQIYHISSHVGDEFLLSSEGQQLQRINLSYEAAKWYARYKNPEQKFSPYAAIGYMVHVDPNTVKRLILEAGCDYFSNKIVFNNTTKLVAGLHVNAWQANNFKGTLNIRAGLQYERTKYCNRYLQLLLEFKKGKSQQGQFYNRNVESVGLVLAFSS